MQNLRMILAVAALLWIPTVAQADSAIKPSPQLPETMPWDLEALSQPPSFEWVDEQSPVRSLFYAGEPYGGQPTRVFAYYATPGTLAGDSSLDKNLPAVVLLHGGGGNGVQRMGGTVGQAGLCRDRYGLSRAPTG